jgi:plasmid stabilization system protein ParE
LSDFPESGRKVPEIDRHEIREVVQGSYRVIYKIEENQTLILIVKSYRQKLDTEEI